MVFLVLAVLASLTVGSTGGGVPVLPTCEEVEPKIAFMALDIDGAYGFGHVAFGYQLDDGSFVVYSFGPNGSAGIFPGPGQLDETAHPLNDIYAVGEYLEKNGYETYKKFLVTAPDIPAAEGTIDSNRNNKYFWNAAGVAPPNTDNCLTFAINVLDSYGANPPPIDGDAPPTAYYNNLESSAVSTTPVRQLPTNEVQPADVSDSPAVDALSIGLPYGSKDAPATDVLPLGSNAHTVASEESKPITLTLYVHDGSSSGPVVPGSLVTGHDGSGNIFEQTVDSNGYVTITGDPGNWFFTVVSDGFEANTWSQSLTETGARHSFLEEAQDSPSFGGSDAKESSDIPTLYPTHIPPPDELDTKESSDIPTLYPTHIPPPDEPDTEARPVRQLSTLGAQSSGVPFVAQSNDTPVPQLSGSGFSKLPQSGAKESSELASFGSTPKGMDSSTHLLPKSSEQGLSELGSFGSVPKGMGSRRPTEGQSWRGTGGYYYNPETAGSTGSTSGYADIASIQARIEAAFQTTEFRDALFNYANS